MSTYIKGKQSRGEIINSSRQIFNEHGIQITLAKLAELMDTTLGRLTHHFRNKDLLFIAIAKDYENKLMELRKKRNSNLISIDTFIVIASDVMDLQYDYRCAMRYIVSSLKNRDEMKIHLQETYANNRENIRNTIEAHVHAGSLQPRILNIDIYEVFLFQLTNLFTNWVINLELYDVNKPYSEVKPTYLKGIISIFLPFLTDKGKQELELNGIFKN
jgi:AcrR family transcriptional regulator